MSAHMEGYGTYRDIAAHAVLAARDQVIAEVELIIGVPENG